MNGLTLITASLPHTSRFLGDAARSIASLRAIFPAPLHWIVVVDGPRNDALPQMPADTEVVQSGSHRGLPVCRNMALGLVETEWVMPLDHDDIVSEGLAQAWPRIEAASESWVAGNVEIIDGGFSPHAAFEPRRFRVRELEENWTAPFAFYPNAVVMRTEAVRSCLGWPGLAAAEDLALVLQLNSFSEGIFLPETFFHYRVWPDQLTQKPGYTQTKAAAFEALAMMVNARRRREGREPIAAPDIAKTYAAGRRRPLYWEGVRAPRD